MTSPPLSPNPLEDHLGYWMRFVSNRVSGAFRERVEARGATVAEWVMLRTLRHAAPLSLNDLAVATGADKAAASRLIERLVVKKLVVRATSSRDRRGVDLSLTAAGKSLVTKLAADADANDALFFGGLNPRDQAHLRRILGALVEMNALTEKPLE
jgi:DNA-binding MarR family transcriptional regulator